MRAIVISMLFISSITYATENEGPQNQGGPFNQVTIDNHSTRNITDDNSIRLEGNSTDVTNSAQSNSEAVGGDSSVVFGRQAPNIYLNPSNQVEACGRTFGISGSNTTGGWAFGLPIPRSWTPTCDLWKAAEEAQQNGHINTSYMFQCSIKAIRKVWGEETCLEFEQRMMLELGFVKEKISGIWIPDDEYESLIMAQVSKEEYDDQQEMVEIRQSQQENLIDTLQQEHDDDEKEIVALKKVVDEALKERDKKDMLEEQKAASFAKIYSKYEETEEETNDEN